MKMTALFAEILIVGLQTLVWLALGAWVVASRLEAPVADLDGLQAALSQLKDWAPLLTIGLLAAAYSIGVVMDRVADSVLGGVGWGLRKSGKWLREIIASKERGDAEEKEYPAFGELRLTVLKGGGETVAFLDYVRSRLRIARATALNTVLIVVFATVATCPGRWRLAVLSIGVPSAIAALCAWWSIDKTFDKRLRKAYDLATGEGGVG